MVRTNTPADKSLEALFSKTDTIDGFAWTEWPAAREDQTHVASGGGTRSAPWETLISWLRYEHGPNGGIYAKSRGGSWSPVSNDNNHRCVESTTAVHSVVLDCDGAGDWDALLGRLDALGAKYAAYRSPSHSDTLPKWRLVLPLDRPYVTKGNYGVEQAGHTEEANRQWHAMYDYVRALAGVEAGFSAPWGVDAVSSFDSSTKSIANAFYLGHRRDGATPLREFRASNGGRPLSLTAILEDAGEYAAQQGHDNCADGSLQVSRIGPKSESKWLPHDFVVDVTGIGPIALSAVSAKAHCRCPEHGGKGKGTAYVQPASSRGPASIRCTKCNKWWGASFAITSAELVANKAAALSVAETELVITELVGPLAAVQQQPMPKGTVSAGLKEPGNWAGLKPAQVVQARAEAASNVLGVAATLYSDLEDYIVRLGMAPWTTGKQWCGFDQLLGTTAKLRVHHRACRSATCTHCAARNIGQKLAAIAYQPFASKKSGAVGAPLSQREIWFANYDPQTEERSIQEAIKRNVSEFLLMLKEGDQGEETRSLLGGHVLLTSGDGKKGLALTTDNPSNSRVWGQGRFQKLDLKGEPFLEVLTRLAKKVGAIEVAYKETKTRGRMNNSEAEANGIELLVPGNAQKQWSASLNVRASHTLCLDPQSLQAAASESAWKVAAKNAVDAKTARDRWAEVGAAGEFEAATPQSKGYATTRLLTAEDDRAALVQLADADFDPATQEIERQHRAAQDRVDIDTLMTALDGETEAVEPVVPSDVRVFDGTEEWDDNYTCNATEAADWAVAVVQRIEREREVERIAFEQLAANFDYLTEATR